MDNQELGHILREISDMLSIKGEDRFRINAYRRVAEAIEHHPMELKDLWQQGRLDEVPGVGEAIAKKIDELFRTGKLEYQQKLKKEIPEGVLSLLTVPDVGPKTAKLLWEELGITSVAKLEKAAKEGRLRELPGLGARSEERILQGIEMMKRRSGRMLLGEALPLAQEIVAYMKANSPVKQIEPTGSLRRRQPTIGDLDILASSKKPSKVMEAFVKFPRVAEILAKGGTKSTVVLKNGLQVDIRVLPEERFGAALQYFTGSKEHNVQLREMALTQGLSLSEYGFTRLKDKKEILCPTEEKVYETLGLPWIPPELRQAAGEIEAAQKGRLPKLVTEIGIRGDFQMHTNYSDGMHTVEEMARAAKVLGYEYIIISDHSQSLGIARGMTPEKMARQRKEIDRANKKLAPFKVLAGCEVEIRADGSLDLPDEVLAELDVVVASAHSGLRQERAKYTSRVIMAMRNPHVDLIAHPHGRLLEQREGADLDFEAVVKEAAKTGTWLEINAHPSRLDLDGEHAREAIKHGVMLVISSDAHSADGLEVMPFGVAMARRGWCEKKHIINTLPWAEVKRRMKSSRKR